MVSVGDSINTSHGTNGGGCQQGMGNNGCNASRGVFGDMAADIDFADIRDGTSNTVMLSERLYGNPSLNVGRGTARAASDSHQPDFVLCSN